MTAIQPIQLAVLGIAPLITLFAIDNMVNFLAIKILGFKKWANTAGLAVGGLATLYSVYILPKNFTTIWILANYIFYFYNRAEIPPNDSASFNATLKQFLLMQRDNGPFAGIDPDPKKVELSKLITLCNTLPFFPIRDTLVLWYKLADRLEVAPQLTYDEKSLDENSVNAQFDKWISENLNHLNKVETLELQHCLLTTLPRQIGQLSNLRGLSAYDNKLKDLPDTFANLKQLKVLDLERNLFRSLPSQIFHCANLEKIILKKNQITSLPEKIENLAILKNLDLSENNVNDLPQGIANLKNLEIIDLKNNELRTLPPQLCQCVNLSNLSLSFNKITFISEEIDQLMNLKFLNLGYNEIRDLPPSICNLKKLTRLALDRNRLITLPRRLSEMSQCTISAEDNYFDPGFIAAFQRQHQQNHGQRPSVTLSTYKPLLTNGSTSSRI